MQKTKKDSFSLPKNIQLTLITLAAIAFVVQALFYIGFLVRVYPNGMRLSPFSIMAFSHILLPAILFAIAFFVSKKGLPRFDRTFHAILLTIIGLAIHVVISVLDRIFSQYTDIYNSSSLFVNVGMIAMPILITLALYAGLLYVLRLRDKKADGMRSLQCATILLVTFAFIADAVFNVSGLVLRHVGSNDITNLLTHPQLITPIVLPLAFFATAYLTLQKTSTLNRLFTSVIYALVGVMTIFITATLFSIGVWTLSISDSASIHSLDLQTIFATVISLTVYTFLIITHNRSKKLAKKSKKS